MKKLLIGIIMGTLLLSCGKKDETKTGTGSGESKIPSETDPLQWSGWGGAGADCRGPSGAGDFKILWPSQRCTWR